MVVAIGRACHAAGGLPLLGLDGEDLAVNDQRDLLAVRRGLALVGVTCVAAEIDALVWQVAGGGDLDFTWLAIGQRHDV